jgi:hypothetical protein
MLAPDLVIRKTLADFPAEIEKTTDGLMDARPAWTREHAREMAVRVVAATLMLAMHRSMTGAYLTMAEAVGLWAAVTDLARYI